MVTTGLGPREKVKRADTDRANTNFLLRWAGPCDHAWGSLLGSPWSSFSFYLTVCTKTLFALRCLKGFFYTNAEVSPLDDKFGSHLNIYIYI